MARLVPARIIIIIVIIFIIRVSPKTSNYNDNNNNKNNNNNNKNNNNNNNNNNKYIVFSLRGLHIKFEKDLFNIWSSVKLNKKEQIYSKKQTLSTNKR